MITHCPHCDQKYEAENGSSGMTAHCSTCGKDFAVLSPISAKHNPNLKKCWCCFKEISKKAKTCPHCGAPIGETEILGIFGVLIGETEILSIFGILSAGMFVIGLALVGWATFDLIGTREPVLMMTGAITLGISLLLAAIAIKR